MDGVINQLLKSHIWARLDFAAIYTTAVRRHTLGDESFVADIQFVFIGHEVTDTFNNDTFNNDTHNQLAVASTNSR